MNMSLESIIKKPEPDFSQLKKVLLRNGIPDYVPLYELFVNIEIMEEILGRKFICKADQVEFYYKAGYDYVPVWPRYKMEKGNLKDTTLPYPITDWESFYKYRWLKPDEISYKEIEDSCRVLPDGMMLIAQDGGPFETMEALLGYSNLCYLLYDDPDLIKAVAEKVFELYHTRLLYR